MENLQLNFFTSLVKGSPFSEREKNFILRNLESSNREIADKLNRTEASIRKFLNSEGIHRSKFQLERIRARIAENQKGEANPNWKNGSSKFPYLYKKKRATKDRLKNSARAKVYRAIRKGELIPQPCEICGKLDNIESHHWDYLKPLEVQWLCKEHHIKADQQRRVIEANFTIERY
jgi:hypothetical protein